jgi:methionyl aminopeptidase
MTFRQVGKNSLEMLQNHRKLQLTEAQRDGMRRAGRFNSQLMDYLRPQIVAGISTLEIDQLVHEYTIRHKNQPATLGYHGYSKSCCTSVNEVICHGIPGPYVLQDGDIINVDITSIVDGWHGDQSETFMIGEVSEHARAVTQCAFDAMHRAIAALEPGCTVSVIGDNVVAEATARGFSVVREYVGHGLGKRFHQYPNIPHVADRQSRQERLLPGMCFTVEPMINVGTRFTKLDSKDGWTVRTRDGKLSAQFEHTVLMREDGPEILTQCPNGPARGHRF